MAWSAMINPPNDRQLAAAINAYAEEAIRVGLPMAFKSKQYSVIKKYLFLLYPDRLPDGWRR